MEQWREIRDFPGYSVSTSGRVRNDMTDHIMALSRNQQGIVYVGLTRDRDQHQRSVALLVATAFIPRPFGPYDTPINLDGDRTNNYIDNLMWRPRWFAIFYHKQFKVRYRHHIHRPIIDTQTKEVCPNSFECATRYGLLEKDLVLSIHNNTVVWPTYQKFEILE